MFSTKSATDAAAIVDYLIARAAIPSPWLDRSVHVKTMSGLRTGYHTSYHTGNQTHEAFVDVYRANGAYPIRVGVELIPDSEAAYRVVGSLAVACVHIGHRNLISANRETSNPNRTAISRSYGISAMMHMLPWIETFEEADALAWCDPDAWTRIDLTKLPETGANAARMVQGMIAKDLADEAAGLSKL